MRNVVAPVISGASHRGLVFEYRYAVRYVYPHATGGTEPNAAAECNRFSGDHIVVGDERVHEVSGIRLRRNVDTAALIVSVISFNKASI